MSGAVRVLVVDDSATMRVMVSRMLSVDPDIKVVGTAPEPSVARQMIKDLEPDVLTLDVEMPGMDGLSFLERIMRLRPMPVVMLSSLTQRGADTTIEALRLGAVDCLAKPIGSASFMEAEAQRLRDTVKTAARSVVRPQSTSRPPLSFGGGAWRDVMIALGASTGGVEALFSLLSALPADCPPILIVQHMPAAFTGRLAARLNDNCAIRVVEAQHGEPVVPGTAYLAPGTDKHMEYMPGPPPRIRLVTGDLVTSHRPSVDVLFRSLVTRGIGAVGAIMTGMGCDGAAGLKAMRDAGARTFGQNENSCVVYGMPRAAQELGAVEREVGLSFMPEAILAACRQSAGA